MTKLKFKDVAPIKSWAEISEDVPPQIWKIGPYREHLRQDLRHIRVMVTPIRPMPRKKLSKR